MCGSDRKLPLYGRLLAQQPRRYYPKMQMAEAVSGKSSACLLSPLSSDRQAWGQRCPVAIASSRSSVSQSDDDQAKREQGDANQFAALQMFAEQPPRNDIAEQ